MAVIGGDPRAESTATAAANANKPGGDMAAFETATDEQIARTPNGTLAHRNYLCPFLRGEKGEARSEADA